MMIARTCLLIAGLVVWGLPTIPGLVPPPDHRVPLARASVLDRSRITIPSGTSIPVTLDQDIPVDRNRFGETFSAHVTRDVVVNGKVAIAQGSPAEVKLLPSDEKANSATLRLSKLEVGGQMRDVSSSARADADEKLGTGKKTAIGAAAGAVVGAVTGAGVIKGAVVGAGGGLAWGLLTHGDNRVKDDTHLSFQLQKDVS